jgi:hypothetical protein
MFGSACRHDPSVSLNVVLPADVAAAADWIEVGAFARDACPSTTEIAGGLPDTGTVRRLAFQSGQSSVPAFGDLAKGAYAFEAIARDANCAVLGIGCTVVDVTDASEVTIDLIDASNGSTACGEGEQCVDARCVPDVNDGDPSAGAGCSMAFLGAGPLADPLADTGTIVSAPAIAATANGFVIAYREYDPTAGDARLTLIPLDLGGAEGAAQQMMLPGACAGLLESDATGLAFASPTSGLVALARAPCNGMGGIDLFEVDPTGTLGATSFNAIGSDTLALSTSHALSANADGTTYLLAYLDSVAAEVAPITGTTLGTTPTAFGGAAPESDAWVSVSGGALGLVAMGTDAGASTARVTLAPPATSLSALPAPFEYAASWAAVATAGTRAFVVNDSSVAGEPVAWTAFDVGSTRPTTTAGFALPGTPIYADVSFHGDYVVFAVEQAGAISLVVYKEATTMPAFLSELDFADDPRIPSTPTLRDGRIAVAASDTRVAVTWATGEMLGDSDAVGGYAMFACSP